MKLGNKLDETIFDDIYGTMNTFIGSKIIKTLSTGNIMYISFMTLQITFNFYYDTLSEGSKLKYLENKNELR